MNMTEENTLKNESLKVYEVGYLLLPSVEETKIQEKVSKIRELIEKNNALFISEGIPEMKKIAYPMAKSISGKKQKFESAYFGWIKFEVESESISLIKKELEKVEEILRFLIIKTTREDIFVSGGKPKVGKFAFEKKEEIIDGDNTDVIIEDEVEKKEDIVDEKLEGEDVKEEKESDKKELDSTIDELVIE